MRLPQVFAALVMAYASAAKADPPAPQPASVNFRMIVNPANPITTVDRKFVSDAFLKRKTTWSDGEVIRPVDLGAESPIRVRFTAAVLDRTVAQIRNYWQQRIFSGRELPPLELQSEQDVVKFVLSYRGALGYVSAGTDIGAAKQLLLREE